MVVLVLFLASVVILWSLPDVLKSILHLPWKRLLTRKRLTLVPVYRSGAAGPNKLYGELMLGMAGCAPAAFVSEAAGPSSNRRRSYPHWTSANPRSARLGVV